MGNTISEYQTVEDFDPEKYKGNWYEQIRTPGIYVMVWDDPLTGQYFYKNNTLQYTSSYGYLESKTIYLEEDGKKGSYITFYYKEKDTKKYIGESYDIIYTDYDKFTIVITDRDENAFRVLSREKVLSDENFDEMCLLLESFAKKNILDVDNVVESYIGPIGKKFNCKNINKP